jgi:hypothetical protein
VVPLRVHVLTADDLPEVDCKLTDDDITRILGKVNQVWNKAGIHFGLESLVREPAAERDRFRLARELSGVVRLGTYRVLMPESTRRFDGLHVYYVHQLEVNGVYMQDDFAFVKETARLRPVEGGIDEPIPRVTSHELGHALGLSHRENKTNLLASGTTGTLLNAQEVGVSRAKASRVKGVRSVPDVRKSAKDATSKGDVDAARRLWTWLAEIPGDGSNEAKVRLKSLTEVSGPATGFKTKDIADRSSSAARP